MYLIVGLGNPGEEYENTRHNLGFRVVEQILSSLSLSDLKKKKKCDALIAETDFSGHKLILAEPQTYMNNSGAAVQALLAWYKIPANHLILIYDDVDLDAGVVRVRGKGSSGGHHGVESIISSIGTTDFTRVRVGIGRDKFFGDVTDYVLAKIPAEHKGILEEAVILAAQSALDLIRHHDKS